MTNPRARIKYWINSVSEVLLDRKKKGFSLEIDSGFLAQLKGSFFDSFFLFLFPQKKSEFEKKFIEAYRFFCKEIVNACMRLEKKDSVIDSSESLSRILYLLDLGLEISFEINKKILEVGVKDLLNAVVYEYMYAYTLVRAKKDAVTDYLYGTNFLATYPKEESKNSYSVTLNAIKIAEILLEKMEAMSNSPNLKLDYFLLLIHALRLIEKGKSLVSQEDLLNLSKVNDEVEFRLDEVRKKIGRLYPIIDNNKINRALEKECKNLKTLFANLPRVLEFDWKWTPGDVLYNIKLLIPEFTYKIKREKFIEEKQEWEFEGKIMGRRVSMKIPDDRVYLLIDRINSFLREDIKKEFRELLPREDFYEFLLSPLTKKYPP